uniref:Hydroxylamine reductase n=1 Tax=Hemiselmis tepida TaxID=464990 RepID=A0A7S0WCE0_9CRYP|mmetsp:Transcript_904/g.2247  ORF Transcript_904/g.2247 Transcript_904/m.2247 type:complete len:610 (+) Transcript_904:53-1882(+)|eukprot:CAMPEP_0174927156 /NCGR_PEP_ID=MMETSP1355-20121228/17982_1 /TAXON_ID=464990 /ORGANISM="Hemiselmis tepida, Strain CCMP443" /LENGTH=609 /DNA_ID=CAMNT_0016173245 /DNA_START=33 /DNA_END=1862 /DNA_ORIENTATION=-
MKAVLASSAVSRALRQKLPAAARTVSTRVLRQQAHVTPATGELYVAPLGKDFNMNKSKMFCNQCSQHQKDCAISAGNCKKTPESARLQDEVVQHVTELGHYAHALRKAGKELPAGANQFVLLSLFSTLTNVNNDPIAIGKFVARAQEISAQLREASGAPPPEVPPVASIMEQRRASPDPNAMCLVEMLLYGLKGVAAYADHARMAGKEDPVIYDFIHEALAALCTKTRDDLGAMLALCLKAGEVNLRAMELLYEGNATLGTPEPTEVQVAPQPGKCVLISGHDLVCMEALLKQCEPLGIKVYTHGEMLPGHAYPLLKKYSSLAGHFGGAWNRQQHEFAHFPGPIVLTSNCLIEPKKAYAAAVYTFGAVGWPGLKHLGDKLSDVDWKQVTDHAQKMPGFTDEKSFSYDPSSAHGQPSPQKPMMTGFGHETVIGAAGTVLAGVEAGAISRFYLIGGCDGDAEARNYYTELAETLPETSVVLTLGCGKYRISDKAKERLGTVGDTGIPRVLDVGQCNDTYSAVRIALALADALKCKVTDLPLSIVLSWYEQKAIAVLLTCLHLGLKPIRIGPVLPAFVTEDVLNVLVKDFGVRPVGDVAEDIKAMSEASNMS